MERTAVFHYFDYKSPYAYLAQEDTYGLERDFGARVEWLPLTLDIPAFLGAAELDEAGRDTMRARNAHQWRRVKYSYMDCRREANLRGLTIRGPRKIFDSRLAHIGMLYAKRLGIWQGYHDRVYERFWKRELDIENPGLLAEVLTETGLDATEFPAYLQEEGRHALARIQSDAESLGVFGVPSYVINGELFWGAERLVRVRERLAARTAN